MNHPTQEESLKNAADFFKEVNKMYLGIPYNFNKEPNEPHMKEDGEYSIAVTYLN